MENSEGEAEGHGVVRGTDSPGGTKTPRMEVPPRGDETSGVPTEGNIVPGGDGSGWGGDENFQATQTAANAGTKQSASFKYGRPGSAVHPEHQVDGEAAERKYREHQSMPAANTTGSRREHGASRE